MKPASPISKNASLVITGALFLAVLVLNAGAFFPEAQGVDYTPPIMVGPLVLDAQDQKGLKSLASGLYKGDDIMQYGNWYGPGWWGGDRKKDRPGGGGPVDGLDAVAQRHDFGYKIAEEQGKIYGKAEERRLKALADYMAVRDAKKLDPDPSKWKPPAKDPTRADEYRNRMITGFTYEAPVYEGVANAGKTLDWVTSPMDNWELDRGQQLDASDLERFVKINIKSWNKKNPQPTSVSTDTEDWTEGETIEIPNEATVKAGEGSENQEVKGEPKPSEEPKMEEKPKGEDGLTDTEPTEPETSPQDEVKPEDKTKPGDEGMPPEDEMKPEEEAPPKEELLPPPNRKRKRSPKDDEDVKPEVEDEPEDEPEAEPEAVPEPEVFPEPGDSVDNADGSTTTTKGYVENKDGRITVEETRNPDGSVTTTHTETDRDGNVISETTYGESGEGKTTRPDNDLRDAEPESDADVDIDTASGGVNTSGSYGDQITEDQQQRSADGSSTMAQNTQMDEASNVGNQQTRDARTARDSGGREAGMTADAAARNTAKSDRENSWGKAVGDGVEAGITEGATAMGSAFGSGAADAAVGAIFGPSKEDSSDGGNGKSVAQGGASGATSGGGSTKGKKKPKGNRGGSRGGGGGGGGGSGSEAGDILVSTESDIPVDGASIDDPIGVTGTSDNDDGTVTITYGCGYTWTGKPPGPARCPVCSRETISTESNSPSEEEEDDDSYDEPKPKPEPEADCTGMTCGRCGYCPCPREPPDPGDEHIICWFHCPKCGWRMAMGDGSGL